MITLEPLKPYIDSLVFFDLCIPNLGISTVDDTASHAVARVQVPAPSSETRVGHVEHAAAKIGISGVGGKTTRHSREETCGCVTPTPPGRDAMTTRVDPGLPARADGVGPT